MEEMKKKSNFYISIIFNLYWKSHSAFVLPNKRYEVGLFQSFRYGYSESLEYSTYPGQTSLRMIKFSGII